MHTTGYADVAHSLAESTVPKRAYKVSGYCRSCIWKVQMWHVSICALCMTLKNAVLLSTAYSSSIVLATKCLQPCYMIFHHGSSHLGFCHIWRQPSCHHGQPSCKMHFTSNNKFKHLSDKMCLK